MGSSDSHEDGGCREIGDVLGHLEVFGEELRERADEDKKTRRDEAEREESASRVLLSVAHPPGSVGSSKNLSQDRVCMTNLSDLSSSGSSSLLSSLLALLLLRSSNGRRPRDESSQLSHEIGTPLT